MTYVLGYYPAHSDWNGKFREIKVQVKHPGLHLRYRRGYFALPDVPLDPKQRQAYMREVVDSPLEATGLGLNVRVEPIDVPGARSLKTELQIDARELLLQARGDSWVGALDLLFVQRGADKKDLVGEAKTFDMRLQRDTFARIRRDGLVLTRNLLLVPGAAELRVVVRDVNSGSTGSVSIPLSRVFLTGGS